MFNVSFVWLQARTSLDLGLVELGRSQIAANLMNMARSVQRCTAVRVTLLLVTRLQLCMAMRLLPTLLAYGDCNHSLLLYLCLLRLYMSSEP